MARLNVMSSPPFCLTGTDNSNLERRDISTEAPAASAAPASSLQASGIGSPAILAATLFHGKRDTRHKTHRQIAVNLREFD